MKKNKQITCIFFSNIEYTCIKVGNKGLSLKITTVFVNIKM